MKPGSIRIVWALCSLALCGTTIAVATRFLGADPLYGFGGDAAFWLFLAASTVVGSVGAFLLLIGIRERNQFLRTTASISKAPDHTPASPSELIVRIVVTLAATDGDLSDDKIHALRCIVEQMEGRPLESPAVMELFARAVSNDIASEVLAAQDWFDTETRDFVLHSCYLILEAMDDPGPVQEDLLVRIAAAMGMSELDLTEHFESFDGSAVPLSRFDQTNGRA